MIDTNRIPESKKSDIMGLYGRFGAFEYVELPSTGGVPNGVKDITHPSVYYNKDGWNGYTHWMVATPYPQQEPLTGEWYENPCIFYGNSNAWHKHPIAFTPLASNPIIGKPPSGYNSDPEIFVHENIMYVINRIRSGSTGFVTAFQLVSSSDGINWSEPEIIYGSQKLSNDVCPMYIFEDGKHRIYIAQMYMNPDTMYWSRANHISIIESESIETPDFVDAGYSAIEGLPNMWHSGIFTYNGKKFLVAGGSHDGHLNEVRGLCLGEQIEGTNDFKLYDKPIFSPNGTYRPFGFVDEEGTLVIYSSFHNSNMLKTVYENVQDFPTGNFIAKIELNMDKLLKDIEGQSLISV